MERHLTFLLAVLIFGSAMGIASVSFAAEGKWTKKTDMPTPRFSLSASAVNGKIYVIGGWGKAGKLLTVEEYDPPTDTWTRKADMPTARKGMATSVVNGKIYAFGGSTRVQAPPGLLTTVEEYDPATNTWTKKKDMPSKRFGAAAVAVDGKIYVMGGWAGGSHTSAVEMYDPATNIWQKRANVPRGLGHTGFASV
ncbi:MAG: hypothetical protein O7E52_08705, partial [Candidatus Poribacteria bacterium]|nr:hypothetical protein [Candidatus Poribacteria bacterium]